MMEFLIDAFASIVAITIMSFPFLMATCFLWLFLKPIIQEMRKGKSFKQAFYSCHTIGSNTNPKFGNHDWMAKYSRQGYSFYPGNVYHKRRR